MMCIGKAQRAALGRVIVLIINGPSGGGWFGYFKSQVMTFLSMRNCYPRGWALIQKLR